MVMKRYRTKQFDVEAIRFVYTDLESLTSMSSRLSAFVNIDLCIVANVELRGAENPGIAIPVTHGSVICRLGDWVVRNPDGTVFVLSDEDFTRRFEEM